MNDPIDQWWQSIEQTGAAETAAASGWLAKLTSACHAELKFQLADARRILDEVEKDLPDDPWRRVGRLLRYRLEVRESHGKRLAEIGAEITDFLKHIPSHERATLARAWHLRGVLGLRLADMEAAEMAHIQALRLIDNGPAMNWVLDGLGQAFVARGAWEEARRTFMRVIGNKTQVGDLLGIAISAGHLARMELSLGNADGAYKVVRGTLEQCGDGLPVASLLRLKTLSVEALLAAGPAERIKIEAAELQSLLEQWGTQSHYLKGFAAMTLARAAVGDDAAIGKWLGIAEANFSLPDQLALLRAWEAKLRPAVMQRPGWWEQMKGMFAASDMPGEAEVMINLILAEQRSAEGKSADAIGHLRAAAQCATQSNNHLLSRRCDDAWERLDPAGFTDQLTQRYSGRSLAELEKLTREDVTIIFSDLVNFTGRVLEMTPDEVMAEMRSLFELSVPLLVRHHVRPIQHLGDGLLAIAHGEGHQARGLQFAIDLVNRTERVTAVRKALASRWELRTRAGVASGPAVLGALGTYYKREFLAIGPAVNLAARLQAAGQPGDVICPKTTADAAGLAHEAVEMLALKGFSNPIEVVRISGKNDAAASS